MEKKPRNPKNVFFVILVLCFLGIIVFTTLPQERSGYDVSINVIEGWQVEILANAPYEISTNDILPCIMQETNTGNMFNESLINGRYIGSTTLNDNSTWIISDGSCWLTIKSSLPMIVKSHPTFSFWFDITIIPGMLIFAGIFLSNAFRKKR